jgi:hypothetical protein
MTQFQRRILPGLWITIVLGLAASACSRDPTTPEEKLARGKEIIKKMSDGLAAANALSITSEINAERVRHNGEKQARTESQQLLMRRPDRVWFKRASGELEMEGWYNGKELTVVGHHHKVFARAPMPENIDKTMDVISERYGITLPQGDLLYSSPEKALIGPKTTGGWVGRADVDGVSCDHLSFQDVGIDWQVWIPASGEPLPKQAQLTYKKRRGAPTTRITFKEWNLAPQVADAAFAKEVPSGYEGIAMIQRASILVNRPEDAPGSEAPPPDATQGKPASSGRDKQR